MSLNDWVKAQNAGANTTNITLIGSCAAGCPGLRFTPREGFEAFGTQDLLQSCKFICERKPGMRMHASASVVTPAGHQTVSLGRYFAADPAASVPAGFERELGAELQFKEVLVCLYIPLRTAGTKEDCWQLARFRKLPHSGPALWKKSYIELRDLVKLYDGESQFDMYLSAVEEALLSNVQAHRQVYLDGLTKSEKTIASLKKAAAAQGLTCSSGITKGGIVDMLIQAQNDPSSTALPGSADLDEFQRDAVSVGLGIAKRRHSIRTGTAVPQTSSSATPEPDELLISAGPGAGKTTTVTNLIVEVAKQVPGSRVLVLAFNVEAAATLRKRLGRLGMRTAAPGRAGIISKPQTHNTDYTGCAVLTFDKMAYQITQAASKPTLEDLFSDSPPPAQKEAAPTTYRGGKEQAAAMLESKPDALAVWDLVIVDEAQDVTALESKMVDQLIRGPSLKRRPGLVAAGDPRQEVYSGASWYSARWSDAKRPGREAEVTTRVLARNYRSAPEIVEALNAYSRAAFPTLHHDQIPVRASAGPDADPVRIIEVAGSSNHAIGEQVGAILAGRPAGESYGLAPVTLERYKVGEATAAVRQTLHEHRPAELTLPLIGDVRAPTGNVYLLATARRIKGTEKPLVVAYGMDRDYDNTVDHASMAKLIFVALSRAQDQLVLVTKRLDRQRIKTLMAPFVTALAARGGAGVVTAQPVRRPQSLRLCPIPVVGESLAPGGAGMGVAQLPYGSRKPWTTTPATAPKIDTVITSKGDHDFIGNLIEAHIALAMQMYWVGLAPGRTPSCSALADPHNLEVVVHPLNDSHGLFANPNGPGHVLCTSHENRTSLEELLEKLGNDGSVPYVHAMLKFSAYCGKPWTVSTAMSDPKLNARIADESSKIVPRVWSVIAALQGKRPEELDEPLFWQRRGFSLGPCRPGHRITSLPKQFLKASVSYETDVVVGGFPVELKYTAAHDECHERQLFSYMAMLGQPTGILYNARLGELRVLKISTAPGHSLSSAMVEFVCKARALLTTRTARTTFIQHLTPYALSPPEALTARSATTAIVLDTEQDHFGCTTEIGAVAVSLTDWAVLGTFQQRVDSVEVLPPHNGDPPPFKSRKIMVELVTRLRRTCSEDRAEAESYELEESFRDWVSSVSPVQPVYVHWSGSEKKLAGDAPTVDVHKSCFIPWLELKNCGMARQGSTKLENAAQQLIPHLPFSPHQAFEDALATLAILMVTVNFGGTV